MKGEGKMNDFFLCQSLHVSKCMKWIKFYMHYMNHFGCTDVKIQQSLAICRAMATRVSEHKQV